MVYTKNRHGVSRLMRARPQHARTFAGAAKKKCSGGYLLDSTEPPMPVAQSQPRHGAGRGAQQDSLGAIRSVLWLLANETISDATRIRTPFVEIAPRDQRAHLAVGNTALEHPEAAIGMDIADAARTDQAFGALDAARDRFCG